MLYISGGLLQLAQVSGFIKSGFGLLQLVALNKKTGKYAMVEMVITFANGYKLQRIVH